MRLERVQIENYRSVRRLTIKLDDVTTIIGEHDCGKSSLISASVCVVNSAREALTGRPDWSVPVLIRSHLAWVTMR